MSECFLDLLRHGEVQGGTRFRGEQDDPLSPLGWEQMRRATSDRPGWTRIISSPSRRCADFARELAGELGLPFEERPVFRERGFGDWEGLAADEIPGELLDRFVRLDDSRSEAGAGLGLSLVTAVMGAHGGRIELSEGPGAIDGFGPGLRTALILPAA